MLPNQQILIHIGYPKSGSSWLQTVLFKDESLGFWTPWSKKCSRWGFPALEAEKQFKYSDDINFSAESTYKSFEPGLREAAHRSLLPVISNESLSIRPTLDDGDRGQKIADRLHAVFPKARILIIIREQKSMIMSAYRFYIEVGGTQSIKEFIGTRTKKTNSSCTDRLNYLRYDSLIEYYQTLFSIDNVLILPLELLKNNQKKFTQRIFNFADLDRILPSSESAKNIAFSEGRITAQRIFNFFCQPVKGGDKRHSLTWLLACKLSKEAGQLLPQSTHENIRNNWKQAIAERVGDMYYESNQRTNNLIGMNLVDFGYDC